MSSSHVFANIDEPLWAEVELKLGQTLVLVRHTTFGGKFLRQLSLPDSHFEAQPVANHGLTPMPGQPQDTHIVAIATARQQGTCDIVVQFAPPNPTCQPDEPTSVAFTVN